MAVPDKARTVHDAWELASQARHYAGYSLERIKLIEQFLHDVYVEETDHRKRLIATEKFLMSEGYRRLDLEGHWTKEPEVEAS